VRVVRAENRLSRLDFLVMAKRTLTASDTPAKSADFHGRAGFSRISPDVAKQGIRSLNIEVPFEEALKLRLALDSCLHAINRYDRSTKKGGAIGVLLSVKTDNSSIVIIETPLRPQATGNRKR
jgi:hypothetical protein